MGRQGAGKESVTFAAALRRGPGVAVWACVLLAVGACSRGPSQPAPAGLAADVARLQRNTALLERQLELAAGKEFYLLLDPAGSDLTLMLRGAELRRFPVLGLQIGSPRVSWFGRRDLRPWQGVVWSQGELDPPRPTDRIVVTVEQGSKGEGESQPPPIPPTAEEHYRVPPRFHIRFSGGLSVEIRPREADANTGRLARLGAWWGAKWGDVAAAMGSSDRDVVRLRVVLKPNDADSLYRSLPPAVKLLVLTGAPAAPGTPAPARVSAASTR
jgi:hypothetical protein